MEITFRICLLVVGIINFAPFFLAIFPNKLTSYGISIPDSNYELLLRHRAVLFGIVGGIMIYSAVTKMYYALSICIGFISMISFLVLYFSIKEPINKELEKVMKMDVLGIFFLVITIILYQIM